MTLLSPDLVEALGWTLIHSLWQGILVFVLLVPVLVLFKKQAPQLRYQILCGALLLFLLGMITTFYLHLPAYSPDQTNMEEGFSHLVEASSSTVATAAPLPLESSHSFREWISRFIPLYAHHLVSVWLLGAFFFAFRWIGGLFFIHRLKKVGSFPATEAWERRLEYWRKKLGIRKAIRLLESARVEVPVIIGHLKPVILLPIGTFTGLEPAQIEAIIIHEMAHIKRNDFLVNVLLSSLEMILFYHPVYWWIANQIQQEREQCCDDIAVAACGNPKLYARTLLLMEEKRQKNALAMAFNGKKNHLLDRIKRICIAAPASYRPEFGKAGLSLCLLLAVAVVSWANMPEVPEVELSDFAVPVEISLDLPGETEAASLTPERATRTAVSLEDFPGEVVSMTIAPLKGISTWVTSSSVIAPDAVRKNNSLQLLPNVSGIPLRTNLGSKTPKRSLMPGFGADTIPYTLNIPKMGREPVLPAAPKFPYDAEKLDSELQKNTNDREFLGKTIDSYKESIDQWRTQVKNDYLSPWENWQHKVLDYYSSWKDDLKAKSKDDKLAYALTLKRGTKHFENALKVQENAIKKSENAIKEDLESYIRSFEEVIKEYEREQEDHDDRMAVHDDRMRVHDLRMSVHDSRMNIHDERMGIHDLRMKLHDSRMEAHDIIMESFKKELFSSLEADGLISKGSNKLDFVAKNGEVRVNDKVLTRTLSQKYINFLKKYDYDVSGDYKLKIKFKGKSTSISYSTSTEE